MTRPADEAPTIGQEAVPSESLRAVKYFGDYELLEEIARGGMGVVYKARQVSLNRIVALKMILAGQLASEADVQRFRSEAEAAAQLDHPNIVPIYEVGEHQGQHYFTMKYIEGGPLTPAPDLSVRAASQHTIALLISVARAVHHAHQRGILHRDLKPGNVLLDTQGQPHVTDFGLAKKVHGDSALTQSGAIVGTPSYMAPEQARAEKGLSTAVDIYSLGAILYEMLSGRPPFKANTALDTVSLLLERDPEPLIGVDVDLATIAMKCLDKEPRRRYESAAALADDLERRQRGDPISARPIGSLERGRRWCKRYPGFAAMAALLVISLLLTAVVSTTMAVSISAANRVTEEHARRAEEHAQVAERRAEEADRERRANARLVGSIFAEKGARFVENDDPLPALPWFVEALRVTEDQPDEARLHRLRINLTLDTSPRLVMLATHDDSPWGVYHVEFSPDSRLVLSASFDHTARLWNVETGNPVGEPMRHKDTVYHAAFSLDGKRIATASYDYTARIWDTSGKPLTGPMEHAGQVMYVAFSPDGKTLATASFDATVGLWDVETGKPLCKPLSHPREVNAVAIRPDGKEIATACSDGILRIWDAKTGKLVKKLDNPNESYGLLTVAYSPDGKSVVAATQGSSPKLWKPAESDKPVVTFKECSGALKVCFSPDGELVAAAGNDSIGWVWTAKGEVRGGSKRKHKEAVYSIHFSPDGQCVLTAGYDKMLRVWKCRDGVAMTPWIPHPQWVPSTAFDGSGRLIATGAGNQVRVWDVGMEPPGKLLTTLDVRTLQFSKDGKHLLAAWTGEGASLLFMDIDQTPDRLPEPIYLPNSGYSSSVFDPVGKRILLNDTDNTLRLWNVAERKVERVLGRHAGQGDFSPDGKYLAWKTTEGALLIWETETGQLLQTFKDPGAVYTWTWRAGTSLLVAMHALEEVIQWDVVTGKHMPVPHPLKGIPFHGTFSPDGRYLLLTGSPQGAVLLDANDWRVVVSYPVPPAQMQRTVVFQRDGKRVSISEDHGGRVWDTFSAQPVSPPLADLGWGELPWFDPAERLLVLRRSIWDLQSGQLVSPHFPASVANSKVHPDGKRWFLASHQGIRVVALEPSSFSFTERSLPARCLSSTRIDASGAQLIEPVSVEQWSMLRKNQPERVRVPSKEEMVLWHRRQSREWEDPAIQAFHLTRLLQLRKDDWSALLKRGIAYAQLGKVPESLADFDAAAKVKAIPANEWYSRGYHISLFDRKQSDADLTRAIELMPAYGEALSLRGLLRAADERYREALDDLERGYKANTETDNSALYAVALLRLHFKKTDEYRDLCRKMIAEPEGETPRLNPYLAACACALTNNDKKDLEKILERIKNDGEDLADNLLAAFTADHLGALRSHKPVDVVPSLRGALLYRLERYDEARKQLEMSSELKDFAAIRCGLFLALTHYRQGKKAEAEKTMKTVEQQADAKKEWDWDHTLEYNLLMEEVKQLQK